MWRGERLRYRSALSLRVYGMIDYGNAAAVLRARLCGENFDFRKEFPIPFFAVLYSLSDGMLHQTKKWLNEIRCMRTMLE